MAKQQPKTASAFFLITYVDENRIREVAEKQQVSALAFAVHDKDEGKVTHSHVLLKTSRSRSLEDVRAMFKSKDENGKDITTTAQVLFSNVENAEEYMAHETEASQEDGKYHYGMDAVQWVKGGVDDFPHKKTAEEKQAEKDEREEENETFLNDLIEHTKRQISCRDMFRKYGRDFAKNRETYVHFAKMVIEEEDEVCRTFDTKKTFVINKDSGVVKECPPAYANVNRIAEREKEGILQCFDPE